MKKRVLKIFVVLVLLAGWALAAAAVHVVRAPGPIPYVGKVTLIPKDRITYRQTYVDTFKWTDADCLANPRIAERANIGPAHPESSAHAAP